MEPEPPTETEVEVSGPEVPAEEETALPAPKPMQERVRFAPLHPEIPAQQRHDFRITDWALGVGSKAEKYAANVAACRGSSKKTGWRRRKNRKPFPAMWAGAALPTASMKSTAGTPN